MKQEIQEVYEMLKNREVNPSGTFDKAGRFYLEHGELVSVRPPSRGYPYSQMAAGRAKKYVKAICEHFGCVSKSELISKI